MFDELVESLAEVAQSNPWLVPLAVFAGGLLTAANPCVLAMVPLMIGYVGGQDTRSVGRSFLLSLAFTVGLTVMFLILFLATWAISSVLRAQWWIYVAACVCLIMGLQLLGILDLKIPAPTGLTPQRRGLLGALLLGGLFGLVSLPCVGPMLAAVLALIPLKGAAYGSLLLVSYSLGHCGLVLVGGISMGLVQRLADSRRWNLGVKLLQKFAGLLILAVGIYLLIC